MRDTRPAYDEMIEYYRRDIDDIDATIVGLLNERFARVKRVAELKQAYDAPFRDDDREKELRLRAEQNANYPVVLRAYDAVTQLMRSSFDRDDSSPVVVGVSSSEHVPDGSWRFDEEVAACFDDMLERSIPQYELMRRLVYKFQRGVLQPGSRIIDLGASLGGGVSMLYSNEGDRYRYTLVEHSRPMVERLSTRFKDGCDDQYVRIEDSDLRYTFPNHPARLVQSILTLQFIPINYRQHILKRAYDALEDDGAFILVEKVLGHGPEIDRLLVQYYHSLKHENGYDYEKIDRKAESLEGELVPVTADWNVDMLRTVGFRHVDCFWRYLNFCGWIAFK